MREIADRTGLTMIQLACQWNLAHPAVKTVVPTLVQEAGPLARPVEEKRDELAALPAELKLTADDVSRSASWATTPARWRSRGPTHCIRAMSAPTAGHSTSTWKR